MRHKDDLDCLIEEIAMGVAALIGIALIIATVVTLLGGCAPTHLTPAEIATTRPFAHPFTNIETFVEHGQQTLEFFDVVAFVAALAGLGIAVWGLLEAEKTIERLGFLIAIVSGVVTAGATTGVIVLPFSPWIVLVVFVGGVGYGGYVIYEKYVVEKAALPVVKA